MDRKEQAYQGIAVVGSTASGKSALALRAAEHFAGEIVSVDSMQVYRTMDIGTAKPTAEELRRVPHHMIDVASPFAAMSAADFATAALVAAKDILARGRLPVFCGGTGLYLDAVLRGDAPQETAGDETVRAELLAFAAAEGAQALYDRLAAVDPVSAEATHPNNVKRVARALEVYLVSGKPKSVWDAESRTVPPAISLFTVMLAYHDRALLYDRIDRRVDEMLAAGLLAETERLLADGVFAANGTAAAAIGYKELLPALRGEKTLAEAAEELKTATRRYAKRQITWFAAKDYVHPLWCDTEDGKMRDPDEVFAELCKMVRENGIR